MMLGHLPATTVGETECIWHNFDRCLDLMFPASPYALLFSFQFFQRMQTQMRPLPTDAHTHAHACEKRYTCECVSSTPFIRKTLIALALTHGNLSFYLRYSNDSQSSHHSFSRTLALSPLTLSDFLSLPLSWLLSLLKISTPTLRWLWNWSQCWNRKQMIIVIALMRRMFYWSQFGKHLVKQAKIEIGACERNETSSYRNSALLIDGYAVCV